MRRLASLVAAAKRDLEGVPRRTWFSLGLLVLGEVVVAVVVLKILS